MARSNSLSSHIYWVCTCKNLKSNWSDKIDKIKNIVASWRERDLSLFGKIQVMKTFIISQFVLPASLLTVPPKIVKQIENVLYEFLWEQRIR